VFIGGFIITGVDSKKVLMMAKGPSVPVPGNLADPVLELHDSNGALMTTNDNWKDSAQKTEIENSGFAPADDKESAILQTLGPGSYTAIVRGVSDTTGIALLEVYDLSPSSNSKLANISSRSFVATADEVMIAGFITGPGSGSSTAIVVRALGPSLSTLGVPNVLADPVLELHDSNGATFASNDDWQTDSSAGQVQAAGLAPKDTHESAIYFKLAPSSFTAIVRGKNNATGVGLAEVYNVK
jgi:hypothetical protein